jgi:hypothetical protein
MMFLIGGPLYLIGKAMERRAARKAKAWAISPAGLEHHTTVAGLRVDSLGPLSQREHDALLCNILFMTSLQGSITWEGVVAQTAGARQVARHYPNGLPGSPRRARESPKASEPESDSRTPRLTAGVIVPIRTVR